MKPSISARLLTVLCFAIPFGAGMAFVMFLFGVEIVSNSPAVHVVWVTIAYGWGMWSGLGRSTDKGLTTPPA